MTPPAETIVREANTTDTAALAPLITELGYPVTAAVIAERLGRMHRAGEVVLVAERDREVLGVITVHETTVMHRPTTVGRISMLVVATRAHGLGVGRALVAAAERLLASRGCSLVEVTSNQQRIGAHAFYERLGYEKTSVRFKKDI